MNIKVKITKLGVSEKVKAIADAVIADSFAVHGIKIIENEKGVYIAMPNERWTTKDGETKYTDIFHPVNQEARAELQKAVFAAYDEKLRNN
ncbi:MAG: hypothetical protein A2Y17_10470 [Clostridiales bacterium GWF2_38_85]|nr:MAG: hypothetical protein A2Y17_10470 [Clostridiales bacterium GWF2_38_85]